MGSLLASGTLDLAAGENVVMTQSGTGIIAARFDLAELTTGDTVIIRYTVALVEGGTGQSHSWEIEHGTTTHPDWVGTFGTNATVFDTPVLWFAAGADLTIEQTVGTLIDVPYEIWSLGT